MIDPPQIVQTQAQRIAYIPLMIAKSEIQQAMGPGIKELMATLKEQGIAATGPWFTHHLRMDKKVWDFRICMPVAQPVAPHGRVEPGEMPARQVARTVYHGGYEGLGTGWAEFMGWIESNGHRASGDLWEVYLSGPESGQDASQWRTELNRPLTG